MQQRPLDAAHILADSEEASGHAVVPDGIPSSKIHHAAFDARSIVLGSRALWITRACRHSQKCLISVGGDTPES